jgi:hypothetical protein
LLATAGDGVGVGVGVDVGELSGEFDGAGVLVGVESGVVELEEFGELLLPGVESGDVLVLVSGLDLVSVFAFGLELSFGLALVFGLVFELLDDEESDPSALPLLLSLLPLSPSPSDPCPFEP